jgi:hypothetical protein
VTDVVLLFVSMSLPSNGSTRYNMLMITNVKAMRKFKVIADIMERITEQPDVLENVVTCDETWIIQYDPETKKQSMYWKEPTSPRMKKARMSKSKMKAMAILFFNI